MAEKLTEIPRPKVSSYKPSRKIYLVATMFGFQGAPKDLQSKLETYWNDVRNQIENLEQSLTKITQVYHESVFDSGDKGLEAISKINPYAYSFITPLCQSTAKLEPLEDKNLLQEEYDWRMCSSAGLTSEKVYSLVIKNLEESTTKRWDHTSKVIDSTLPENEAALLIVNENHKIQFPEDIQVFYISPPSFDAIKRWVDEQIRLMMKSQKNAAASADSKPPNNSDKSEKTTDDMSNKQNENKNAKSSEDEDQSKIYPY